MKITFLLIGKTTEQYIEQGINNYINRLKFYVNFELKIIPELKNTKSLSVEQQKSKESELILKQIEKTDFVVLLDEKGKEYTSVGFSKYIEQHSMTRMSDLVFVVGGPYGFDRTVYERGNHSISLSQMTFSHQMVRLFFVEQLYRAHTIIKGEPYHHQ